VAPPAGRPRGQYRSRYLATATVYNCTKPTIAAVNGVAVGAGFSLAMACDIRIASEAARFSAIFVKRAIVADTGCTWFLPRLIGQERALEMMYTGRMVGADEALRIGLVSEVVPAEQLAERATALAIEIARGPSLAVELNKRLTREAWRRTLEEQIELEEYLQAITHKSEDAQEGRASFVEGVSPSSKATDPCPHAALSLSRAISAALASKRLVEPAPRPRAAPRLLLSTPVLRARSISDGLGWRRGSRG
jgi:2-(1,2-epoxy-1,2-dihydrophenyl)acetyl-CoA isomerase